MKYILSITVILVLLVVLSTGCSLGAAKPTPTAVPATATVPAGGTLDVASPASSKTLKMSDIKALPAVEGWAGTKSSTGRITPPARYKGIPLITIAQQVGGLSADQGIRLVAKDGYAMTLSGDQVTNGTFVTYDPGTGDELKTAVKLTAILAYEVDGQPLPEDSDGAFRLVVISDKNNQVVDGHWSVKWVTKVEVKSLADEWTLALAGKLSETMDRATFESCSSPSCHGKTWTDEKAQTWSGTPLWLIAGRVDDDNKHSTGAFNTELAEKGYTVTVAAKDGFTASFASSRIKDKDGLLVADLVNNNPLDEKYFPLRLVGPGLTGKESVGQITQITIESGQTASATPVPPTATPAPPTPTMVAATPTKAAQAAATGPAALVISGAVEKPASWTLADVKAVGVVKLELEHPKKGKGTYEGVRLNALLSLAKPSASATTLTFVASDGYKTNVSLADVLKCTDCLVAFDSAGALSTAMPGMESGAWAKNLIMIEVK